MTRKKGKVQQIAEGKI